MSHILSLNSEDLINNLKALMDNNLGSVSTFNKAYTIRIMNPTIINMNKMKIMNKTLKDQNKTLKDQNKTKSHKKMSFIT